MQIPVKPTDLQTIGFLAGRCNDTFIAFASGMLSLDDAQKIIRSDVTRIQEIAESRSVPVIKEKLNVEEFETV